MQLIEWLSQTMIVERAVGVLTYTLIVIYVYRAIKYRNTREAKRALNIALLIFVVISFFCITAESADLTRIREMTESWAMLPTSTFFERFFTTSSTPVGYLLYYVTAKIGIQGLLPAFCAFVFYLNSFHVFKALLDSDEYSKRSLAYAFLLFMSAGSFYEVISGVRCFMAFSIVLRFIFDELYFDKTIFRHILFFIIAALIHPAAIVLVVIWLIYYVIFGKKRNKFHTVINILTAILFIAIGIRYGNVFIDEVFRKATAFISSKDAYSYIWEYVIGSLQLFVGFYILIIRRRHMGRVNSRNSDFVKLTTLYYILVVVLCFEYNIFHRYLVAASFLFIPVVAETLTVYEREHWNRNCYMVVQISSYLILLIACLRGNLCGFKYFLLF